MWEFVSKLPLLIFFLSSWKFLFQIPEKRTIHTFDRPISGKQEAEIFDPVVVIPEIVLFPWYPAAQKNVAEYKQFQYLLEVKWIGHSHSEQSSRHYNL